MMNMILQAPVLDKPQRKPSISDDIVAPNKIGEYLLKEVLGEGGFSQVRVAVHETTGVRYACKIVPKKRLIGNQMEERFEREIRILQQCSHEGIAQMYDIYKDMLNYYIILELCTGGSLLEKIIEKKKFTEIEAKRLFTQIISTLDYLHSKGIAHRDIKPENILLNNLGQIKFIDFGLSAIVVQNNLFSTRCGTTNYVAPELVNGDPYDGQKVDIWSLGVVLYVMLFGHTPWTKTNQTQLVDQIKNGYFFIPTNISPEARDILLSTMHIDPMKRLNTQNIIIHPWLRDVQADIPNIASSQSWVTDDKIEDFFERRQNICLSQTFSLGLKSFKNKSVLNLIKRNSVTSISKHKSTSLMGSNYLISEEEDVYSKQKFPRRKSMISQQTFNTA